MQSKRCILRFRTLLWYDFHLPGYIRARTELPSCGMYCCAVNFVSIKQRDMKLLTLADRFRQSNIISFKTRRCLTELFPLWLSNNRLLQYNTIWTVSHTQTSWPTTFERIRTVLSTYILTTGPVRTVAWIEAPSACFSVVLRKQRYSKDPSLQWLHNSCLTLNLLDPEFYI